MRGCELVIGITALAIAIAAQIEDDEELVLMAAALTQLGDTLATLAASRAKCAAEEAARAAVDQGDGQAEKQAATEGA